jgi:hypothetical protein
VAGSNDGVVIRGPQGWYLITDEALEGFRVTDPQQLEAFEAAESEVSGYAIAPTGLAGVAPVAPNMADKVKVAPVAPFQDAAGGFWMMRMSGIQSR